MKKILFAMILSLNLLFGQSLIVGATPVPHSEILDFVKPILKEKGIDLEIKIFNDYVMPNRAVDEGDLDANFFQHEPYLIEFNKNNGTDLVKTIQVHLEPMAIYSKKIKNLNELKNSDKVSLPNDPTNESRALELLEKQGIVKLDKNVVLKTPLDIIENPKNLDFIEIESASLPRTLDDVAISVINSNFAFNADLNPLKDALAIEDGKDNPYSNIIVVKNGNENSEKIKLLNEALQSKKTKDFIIKKFNGAIIPAF